MFRQGQLAVHGLAILLGRNEAGISNRGKIFLPHCIFSSSQLLVVAAQPAGVAGVLDEVDHLAAAAPLPLHPDRRPPRHAGGTTCDNCDHVMTIVTM